MWPFGVLTVPAGGELWGWLAAPKVEGPHGSSGFLMALTGVLAHGPHGVLSLECTRTPLSGTPWALFQKTSNVSPPAFCSCVVYKKDCTSTRKKNK